MIKKGYKDINLLLRESKTRDDKESGLSRKYVTYLDIFKGMFFVLYKSRLKFDLFRKTRNKWTRSKIKIKKYFDTRIIISLCLLDIFIPYRNKLQKNERQLLEPSGRDLVIIRWIAVGYNFFIDIKEFKKITDKYPEIKKEPTEYNKFLECKWGLGYNFDTYAKSIDKGLFMDVIGYLCKQFDQEALPWSVAEFLWISVRIFLDNLDIKSEDLNWKSTWIHIKTAWKRMIFIDSLFEKIYLWNIWNKSYHKTRNRFRKNFADLIEAKLKYWKKFK